MTQNPTQVYSIQINNEVRRYLLQLSVSQGVMQTLLEFQYGQSPEEVQRTALCVFDFGRITSILVKANVPQNQGNSLINAILADRLPGDRTRKVQLVSSHFVHQVTAKKTTNQLSC